MKLGRYEVVRELGKGAMGVVYLAKDPLIGRLVALKTIRLAVGAEDDETREFQQRFIREAQAAGILNHPAIVTVHDIGQDEGSGVSFIAMEYVEGHNLKEVLAQGRPLTWEMIAEIIAQIAEGLDYAHAKGIVHRDVKPANIILVEGNRAKITDFGIAKIAHGAANLTTTGQFLGTPNYMAPEQIKGSPVDGRTDIFSLGICLYECLTRRKPFGGDSLTSISYKIVHEGFSPLHEVNPQIPEGFETVVSRALAKDPVKRYQRANEMCNALRAIARGEKPAPVEPMQVEETVLTRETPVKIPTIEVPFPDALDLPPAPPTEPGDTPARTIPDRHTKPTVIVPTPGAKTAAGPGARIWKRRVPSAIFFGTILLLLAITGAWAASILAQRVEVPPRDLKAENARKTERALRVAGNQFIAQGRVDDAYAKFVELQRIAPRSPAARALVFKLGAARQAAEMTKQQRLAAQKKLDEGLALYNAKRFDDAIPVLQEAFSLNPSSEQAANYLKFAQLEQQRIDAERALAARTSAPNGARPSAGPRATATAADSTQGSPAVTPSQLVTQFTPPVADGSLIVKVGADTVVRENLFEERGRLMFRRKVARPVNVTRPITPANTDVYIWVLIPSLGIQEHKVFTRQRFQPGVTRRLVINYDAQSKRFDYQLN